MALFLPKVVGHEEEIALMERAMESGRAG